VAIIPPTQQQISEQQQQQKGRPSSDLGFSATFRADPALVAAPEERTTPQLDFKPLSVKARRRGGDYGLGAAVNDLTGGVLAAIAIMPDALYNGIARQEEKKRGVPEGTYGRDWLDRIVRAGNYEEADWLADGILRVGKGEELGTGSKRGNILEATGEFATLAVPFGMALKSMAAASKASKAAAAGKTVFRQEPRAGAGGVGVMTPGHSPIDPLTGRAVGTRMAPTTVTTTGGVSTKLPAIEGFAPTTGRGRLKESILAPWRINPKKAMTTEVIYGALSGAGLGIDQEVYGGSGLIGAIAAPFAPAALGATVGKVIRLSPIRWMINKGTALSGGVADDMAFKSTLSQGNSIDNIVNSTDPKIIEAKKLLGVELAAVSRDPTQAGKIERAQLINKEFGYLFEDGTVPLSIAEILQNRLITQKSQISIASRVGAYEDEVARVDDMLLKIKDQIQKNYDLGLAGNPNYIFSEITNDFDDLISASTTQQGQLRTRLDELALNQRTQSERAAAGASTREDIMTGRQAAVDRLEAEANRTTGRFANINKQLVDPLASKDDLVGFANSIDQNFSPKMGKGSLTYQFVVPKQIKEFTSWAQKENTRLTFQDWKKWREAIGESIGHARASGNKTEASYLGMFQDQLDEFVTGRVNTIRSSNLMPEGAVPAGTSRALNPAGKRYLDFVDAYKREVIEPFDNSYLSQVTRRQGGTKEAPLYQTRTENIADGFLTPEGIDGYIGLFGRNGRTHSPARMDDARNAMRDKAFGQIYDGKGALNPEKLQQFTRQNDDVLRKLDLLDEFTDTATAYKGLSDRLAVQTELAEGIANNSLYKLLNKFGDQDADLLMTSIFNNPAKLGEAFTIVKAQNDPALLKAWNANVVDEALKSAYKGEGLQGIMENPSQFLKWLGSKEAPINRLKLVKGIGEEQTDRLQLLADWADRANTVLRRNKTGDKFINLPSLVGASNKTIIQAIAKATGTSIPGATARFIAVQEGRIGVRTALAYFAVRALNSGQTARYDAVLAEALRNPNFARQLMKEAPEEMIKQGEVALPLALPRDTAGDFLFRRGLGIGAGTAQAELGGEFVPPPTATSPQEILPVPRNIDASLDPQFQYSIDRNAPNQRLQPVRPPPASGFAGGPPPPTGIAAAGQPVEEITETTSFSELFPFDPTGQAISNRRTQGGGGGGGGLGSLI
jgi:hypothetical protein